MYRNKVLQTKWAEACFMAKIEAFDLIIEAPKSRKQGQIFQKLFYKLLKLVRNILAGQSLKTMNKKTRENQHPEVFVIGAKLEPGLPD